MRVALDLVAEERCEAESHYYAHYAAADAAEVCISFVCELHRHSEQVLSPDGFLQLLEYFAHFVSLL